MFRNPIRIRHFISSFSIPNAKIHRNRIIYARTLNRFSSNTPRNAQEQENSSKSSSTWKDFDIHRQFFDELATKLDIRRPEDWYRVSAADVLSMGGSGLLSHYYNGSLVRALTAVYPAYDWKPWMFKTAPFRFWDDVENQRKFFDWAASQLRVESWPDDWYRVRQADVLGLKGGSGVLKRYGGSLRRALAAVYPQYEWDQKRWSQTTTTTTNTDESSLSSSSMNNSSPLSITGEASNSNRNSNNENKEERREIERERRSRLRHRKVFDFVAKQLNITNLPDDWYKLSHEDIARVSTEASDLLRRSYGGSLCTAISTLYPPPAPAKGKQKQFEWVPWRFASGVPRGFWSDKSNHRRFFDWVARELGIRDVEDWYGRALHKDVVRLGGAALLNNYYDGSIAQALVAVYPEVEWQPWRFPNFTANSPFVRDPVIIRRYIDYLTRELKITHLDEWYRVSIRDIRKLGGYLIISENAGLFAVLRRVYPDFGWAEDQFNQGKGKKAAQRWLMVAVQQLFPNEEIFEEFVHPTITFKESNLSMTLDVWIPSLSLAFEYQGVQHYIDKPLFGNPGMTQLRDAEKAAACKEEGITLVKIPYWWNRSVDDLAATICASRPDLAERSPLLAKTASSGVPISAQKPHAKTLRNWDSTYVSEYMMLASQYEDTNPTGWWMSEKLDGIRAYWDGEQLLSRQGNPIPAPDSFIRALPKDMKLDGELWVGRGKFQELQSIYTSSLNARRAATIAAAANNTQGGPGEGQKQIDDGQQLESQTLPQQQEQSDTRRLEHLWRAIQYCVFDAPSVEAPFEQRYAALQARFGVVVVPSTTITTTTTTTTTTTPEDDNSPIVIVPQTTATTATKTAAPTAAHQPLQQQQQESTDEVPPLPSSSSSSSLAVVRMQRCKDKDHLQQYFNSIVQAGGEGVVLRKPGSLYEYGRSASMLKLKPTNDTEVKVIGRHQSQYGLLCEQLDGDHQITVYCEASVYHHPPPAGTIITVSCNGTFANGRLRNPRFLRVRESVE